MDSGWILDLDMLGGFRMDSEGFRVDSRSGYAGGVLGGFWVDPA
jgi:hypothetical protein